MAQDKKRDEIIEAAKKRFSHFGVAKTTMNEIADDLSISKASLYYYFPDKLNLYAAVLQGSIEAERANERDLLNEQYLLNALNKYLETRTEFIIKNYNILEYLKTIGTSFPSELETIFIASRSRDINLIATILSNNAKAQGLKIKDTLKVAELLIECLDGLRHATFGRKANFFPDQGQFYKLLIREKEVAAIFVKGLSC
ncbi:MAG: TetR/AcrR family transcriptional regulator [Daejeonella sp.]|uniref:TetR/AcrR family transcriptional regulator n=1 Tax=unclassified Daejeonella TaxID=2805396 RepID=UPI0023EE0852|nr:TetR/AcrR family transcriptional regulator [Daejeonella sp. JGW-45]